MSGCPGSHLAVAIPVPPAGTEYLTQSELQAKEYQLAEELYRRERERRRLEREQLELRVGPIHAIDEDYCRELERLITRTAAIAGRKKAAYAGDTSTAGKIDPRQAGRGAGDRQGGAH